MVHIIFEQKLHTAQGVAEMHIDNFKLLYMGIDISTLSSCTPG